MTTHSSRASAIDLAALEAAPLDRDPYDHVIVPGFVKQEALAAINGDFPRIDKPGSFPVDTLSYGPAFAALLAEFDRPETRASFEEKFDIDLSSNPLMCTVRGRCRWRDGQIHTDSASKVLTLLLYMNAPWEHPGGLLRLLRSADDIEDYAVEVPPNQGTLLAFRCTENAWHGHKPFEGERRAVQLNWVTSRAVVWREQWRHRLSARIKGLLPAA